MSTTYQQHSCWALGYCVQVLAVSAAWNMITWEEKIISYKNLLFSAASVDWEPEATLVQSPHEHGWEHQPHKSTPKQQLNQLSQSSQSWTSVCPYGQVIVAVTRGPTYKISYFSYDNARVTIDLRRTDRRLIYKTSYEQREAFLRYHSLAKS